MDRIRTLPLAPLLLAACLLAGCGWMDALDGSHDHGTPPFGDDYTLLVPSDGVGGAVPIHLPRIDGDTLRAWVGFSGCSRGTFSLVRQRRAQAHHLAIHHDYPLPPGGWDCDRYNFHPVALALPERLPPTGRLLLLNPNRNADPVRDAFVLR